MHARDIAELVDGRVVGDPDLRIDGVAAIETATGSEATFVASRRYARHVATTRAGLVFIAEDFPIVREDLTYVRVADPYEAFLTLLEELSPSAPPAVAGVHPTAIVGRDVTMGEDVSIGPGVVIEHGCRIGDRTVLLAGVVLGPGVRVGADTTIEYNASIYHGTVIGNRVVIHAGTVIGASGFGFVEQDDGSWRRVRQIGGVDVGDDVEIGANVTIDRAALGMTRIGDGTKIDNLVHIAHNVEIGDHTAIAAQTGVSGSTRIGRANRIAGQVGFVGHIETAADVIIEAQSGVSKTIRKSGRYFGHPAKEHSQALRQEGALRQLPDLLREIRELRDRIRKLENSVDVAEGDEVS